MKPRSRQWPASVRCWWWASTFLLFSRKTSSSLRDRWKRRCWWAITWSSTASRWPRLRNGCLWSTIASRGTATLWSSSSPLPSRSPTPTAIPSTSSWSSASSACPATTSICAAASSLSTESRSLRRRMVPTIKDRASTSSISTNFPPFRRPRLPAARKPQAWPTTPPITSSMAISWCLPACTS